MRRKRLDRLARVVVGLAATTCRRVQGRNRDRDGTRVTVRALVGIRTRVKGKEWSTTGRMAMHLPCRFLGLMPQMRLLDRPTIALQQQVS